MKQPKLMFLDSEDSVFFDVDETLVMWDPQLQIEQNKAEEADFLTLDHIHVIDPYIKDKRIVLKAHKRNINLLKRVHGQGKTVIVWSYGGSKWALLIVKSLKLEKYVSLVLKKPEVYVDDTLMADWKPKHVFLPDV